MIPTAIFEDEDIFDCLQKINFIVQYKKAKQNILSGENTKVYFKERKPKGSGKWYFRINRQFRAIGRYEGSNLIVFMIDPH